MSEAVNASSIIAETTQGPVQGRIKDDILLFAGIPYAAPPIGPRRFKAPIAHPAWTEVRQATRFSPAAPQVPTGGMTANTPVNWSEDCLYLNISTPALDDAKRPVFFWIHGGGYRTGQGAIPWYSGSSFAGNGDIVVVSINYRMGAFAFADLSRFGDEFETSGANGTLDQIFALKWVRENIANFGGDPDQITIAGESAGAFSVGSILGSPLAVGDFKRAILQSGASHHVLPKEAAEKVTDVFLEKLGVDDIDGLQTVSPDDILKVQAEIDAELGRGLGSTTLGLHVSPFYPAAGNSVLPVEPLTAIQGGMNSNVDVMLGTNKDEATLFLTGKVDEARLSRMAEIYGGGEAVVDAYKAVMPDASPKELLLAIQTDHLFRIPVIRLAEARAATGAKTWMYFFAWESRISALKSTHALEIPFVFNTLKSAGVDVFLGPGEVPQALADEMHGVWTSFIKTGEPGWPEWDPETRVNQRFDTTSELVNDPDDGKRQAWEGIR